MAANPRAASASDRIVRAVRALIQAGPWVLAKALGGNRVQLPIVGDALERVYAAVCEGDAGADDQILHRPRSEELILDREVADTSGNYDAEAGDVVTAHLHLSGVEPRPDVEPQRLG